MSLVKCLTENVLGWAVHNVYCRFVKPFYVTVERGTLSQVFSSQLHNLNFTVLSC